LTGDPLKETELSAGNCIPALTVPLFASMIVDIPTWKVLEGLLFHFDKRRPVLFLALKAAGMKRVSKMKPLVAAVAKSRRLMGGHLDALEAQLEKAGGPWILGDAYTLADVSWLVIFERLVQADWTEYFMGKSAEPDGSARRPQCAAYWDRLTARPGYKEAIEGHSHPTIIDGTARLRSAKAASEELRVALEGA
jgi:glutathione S-transferase